MIFNLAPGFERLVLCWVIVGILHLVVLTYQDIKNNKLVDDRHNWLMMGLTVSLFTFYNYSVFYLLGLILGVSILFGVLNKFKVMGGADLKTVIWSFMGFGVMGVGAFVWYAMCFVGVYVLYWLLSKVVGKVFGLDAGGKLAGYPVFLVCFPLTAWIVL